MEQGLSWVLCGFFLWAKCKRADLESSDSFPEMTSLECEGTPVERARLWSEQAETKPEGQETCRGNLCISWVLGPVVRESMKVPIRDRVSFLMCQPLSRQSAQTGPEGRESLCPSPSSLPLSDEEESQRQHGGARQVREKVKEQPGKETEVPFWAFCLGKRSDVITKL